MKSRNVYIVPFNHKIWAISHPKAHFAHFKDAIDFILPEGTEILAAQDGVIDDQYMESTKGGVDLRYNDLKYLNRILIKHDNNESSQYCHLKHQSHRFKVGDSVKKGQVIGQSGNTGLSTTPHLHFVVWKDDDSEIGFHSVEPRFDKKFPVDRTAREIPREQNELESYLDSLKSAPGQI